MGPRTPFFYFVTDGQNRDYLSRDSQRARGATNKKRIKILHKQHKTYHLWRNSERSTNANDALNFIRKEKLTPEGDRYSIHTQFPKNAVTVLFL